MLDPTFVLKYLTYDEYGSKSLYTGKKPLKDWAVYAGSPVKLIKYRNKNCKELSKKYN